MPNPISNLNPRNWLNKIENKIPCVKKITSNPKVKKIALEVFKALGIMLLGAVFGALVAVPGGAVLIGVAAGVGALAGGIAYLAVKSVFLAIEKRAYPANKFRTAPPASIETWLTDENLTLFKKVLREKFRPHPWYQDWKHLKHLNSDAAAERHLWRMIQKGVCNGKALSLVELMRKESKTDTKTLLEKIPPETLYEKQILEFMRADFKGAISKSPNHLSSEKRAALPGHHDTVKKSRNEIKNAKAAHPFSFGKTEILDPKKLRTLFKEKVRELRNENPQRAIAGTIRLQNKKGAHTLFIELEHGRYRFYDSFGRFTGFYEGFKSGNEFYLNLQKHLKAYAKTYAPFRPHYQEAIVQLYAVEKK